MEILHPVKATFRTSDKNQLSNPDVSFMVEIFNQLQGKTYGFFFEVNSMKSIMLKSTSHEHLSNWTAIYIWDWQNIGAKFLFQ